MRIPARIRPDDDTRLASRRAVLARTVTGAVGVAAAGAALSSISAAPAGAATGVTDWINVTDYGADPSGVKDSAGPINKAIAAAKAGGVVYLPTGIFLIASPIVLKTTVTLVGDHGATSSGDDAGEFAGTVIRIASGFQNTKWAKYATAAILCLDQSPGTNGSQPTLGIRLQNFWIDGSGQTATAVDGVTCYGPVSAWQAERIGVYRVSGNGFSFIEGDGKPPDGQHLYSCVAQQCTGEGFTGLMLDATLVDCHAQGCGSNGIHLTGGNTRFIGCRADLNAGHGWYLDHGGAGDGYSDAIILDGCGTQRNNHHGVFITNGGGTDWHDPVFITGCSIAEDGQNGTWSPVTKNISGGNGIGWAGIHVEGENHVHISNTLIALGTVDVDLQMGGCPQYGIETGTKGGASPVNISVSGGRIEARQDGALINDAAGIKGAFRISPETVGAITYQSDNIIARQGAMTLVNGSAIVPNAWVSAFSRIYLSTLDTSSPGFLSVSRGSQTFTINSTSGTDASTVAWMITTA